MYSMFSIHTVFTLVHKASDKRRTDRDHRRGRPRENMVGVNMVLA